MDLQHGTYIDFIKFDLVLYHLPINFPAFLELAGNSKRI